MLQNVHVDRIAKYHLKNKQDFTNGFDYDRMMTDDEALAHNLKRLMEYHGYTQMEVATKADVSQKQISDILNRRAKLGPSLGQISAIAKVFKISTWHLLLLDCPPDLLFNATVEKLVENYANNDDIGRNATLYRSLRYGLRTVK